MNLLYFIILFKTVLRTPPKFTSLYQKKKIKQELPCCILLLLVDLSQVLWGPSRHLGSLTAANWVSFDLNEYTFRELNSCELGVFRF